MVALKTLSENLKELLSEVHLSEAELARKTGIGQPVINRLVKGTTKNPNIDTLKPIANFFCVTIGQLIGGEPLPKNRIGGTHKAPKTTRITVPLLTWEEACNWQKLRSSYKATSFSFAEVAVSEAAFALQVRDSSLEPKFSSGTIFIVDPKLTPRNRSFVIISFPKQPIASFKQYLIDGGNIYLKSVNPDFDLIKVGNSSIKVIGIVVEARVALE